MVDIPLCYPVIEHYTGIHNYPFKCLRLDPIGKSFPDLSHTPANAQLYCPVVELFIDVERHTGILNYTFRYLRFDLPRNHFHSIKNATSLNNDTE